LASTSICFSFFLPSLDFLPASLVAEALTTSWAVVAGVARAAIALCLYSSLSADFTLCLAPETTFPCKGLDLIQ